MQSLSKATNLFVAFFLFTLAVFLVALCFPLSATAQNETKTETTEAQQDKNEKASRVYYALGDQFNAPTKDAVSRFNCTDKIFTVVELSNYPEGKHQLSVRWLDPTDGQREHTKYEFLVNQSEVRLWAWLRLSRAQGAGMLTWINPAAGLEEFVGPWTVEVRVNNKKISDDTFEVSC